MHVIVIGGASCTGKTTIAAQLLRGELPVLADAIGLEPGAHYHVLHGKDWSPSATSGKPRVLLQYDVTAETPFAREGELQRGALEWLAAAQSLTLLTVWERPDELDRRLARRFHERGGLVSTVTQALAKRRFAGAWRSVARFHQRRRLFRRPDRLWDLYERWVRSCAGLAHARHWLVQSTAPERVTPFPERLPSRPFWVP